MENLVWYVCYGSNLLKKRFLLYIEGGRADIVPKTYSGCSDKTPPQQYKPYVIPYELYFAKSSEIWEGKGVAFIKSQRDSTIKTLSRLYLITKPQFGEVFLQENGLDPRSNSIELDLSQIKAGGELKLNEMWYGRVIYLGEEGGYPVLTFTAPWDDDEIVLNPPGEKYLSIIIKGLKESYDCTNEDLLNYLMNIQVINTKIDSAKIVKLINSI